MEYLNRCVKFLLPNGRFVDMLSSVISEISTWTQLESTSPESCGFLCGYMNSDTGNITISRITAPQAGDYRTRFFCKLKDSVHFRLLKRFEKEKDFFLGTWHSHPQATPSPSGTDWDEWRVSLNKDRTGTPYIFFTIAGTEEFRIWAGFYDTKEIHELQEANINMSGLYDYEE